MKYLLRLFLLFFFSPAFGQSNISIDSLFDCKFRIKWAIDSNGLQGTRYKIVKEVFQDKRGRTKFIPLEGISEDSLIAYLGKPNIFRKSLSIDGYSEYTYFIKMDWIKPNSYEGIVLIIELSKNKVISYFIMIT